MASTPHLTALDPQLDAVPATVSVWCGQAGLATAGYARLAGTGHYACSMIKVAILGAFYRAVDDGTLDPDDPVPVVNDFASAKPGAPHFALDPGYDQDDQVWARLGHTATLRWLARRMIIRSSNLAGNLVLGHVGLPAVASVLRIAGAAGSRIERGIGDADARAVGLDNVVTAADLAALLVAVTGAAGTGGVPVASAGSCTEMRAVLLDQQRLEDLAAGLPPGTRIAHKNGWIDGVRLAAGVVFADDAPPYAIAACTTATPVPSQRADSGRDFDARALIAQLAAASWADRHGYR